MIKFVAFVKFEGQLFALTEDGAVWRFHPDGATVHGGPGRVCWVKIADGPFHAEGV